MWANQYKQSLLQVVFVLWKKEIHFVCKFKFNFEPLVFNISETMKNENIIVFIL